MIVFICVYPVLTLLKMLNVCVSGIFSWDAENGLNACTDPQIEGL